jgi:glycolate oxidase iron-sulfur subunit
MNTVSLFKGCVGSGLFSHVNEATERVLAVNGFSTSSPKAQVCCGALHAHAGDLENARRLARQNIAAFETANAQAIVTNAGGCGAMLVSYAHLLEDDAEFAARAKSFSARVRDVSQRLTTVKVAATANESQSVTYDASCHLLYGQHAGDAPLRMLNAIGPLDLVPLAGAERCCGGAGIYNLLEPELSGGVLAEKLANIRATGATMVATGNPGCQMQIGAGALLSGLEVNVCHPVELLDQAYAAEGFYDGKG